jgi:cytochrome c-type biogenesis protein
MMESSANISIFIAFTAGLFSFVSPCVLPLIPSYMTYITGVSFDVLAAGGDASVRRRTMTHSLLFILGFSLVFISLGASATLIGGLLQQYQQTIRKVGGIIVVILGLHITGLFRFRMLEHEKRLEFKRRPLGYIGSVLVGIAFAAGWTPCIGPILASILLYAGTAQNVATGIILLTAYSFGLGLPFFIAALAFNTFLANYARLNRYLRIISIISGLFLVVVGVMLFFNYFTVLAQMFNRLLLS